VGEGGERGGDAVGLVAGGNDDDAPADGSVGGVIYCLAPVMATVVWRIT
jgi:hypothetical protein